jgi:hypothetical protein
MHLFLKSFSFVLILGFGPLHAQDKPEYAISLIDTSLLKNAWAVVRNEEIKYIIHSPKEYSIIGKKVVTIFNKDSPETYFTVPYDKYSKAEIKEVTLYDTGGKLIRKVKKSEFTDHATFDGFSVFRDDRYMEFRSFGGQLPYTFEYAWEVEFNNTTANYDDWKPQDQRESVEKSRFILSSPQNFSIHTKTLNHDFEYEKENKEGLLIQSWTLLKANSIVPEESGPPYYEIFPMLLISPSLFQVEQYTGSMTDWKSFGTYLYELNKDKEIMPPSMTALIQQMTVDCKTTLEKIDTLYHWLQNNLRYVSVQIGVGGLQTFDASYVEKNRFGDCKALSTFMKGMLREAGIDSWNVEIKAAKEDGLFLDDFASFHFNHRMLFIPQENMWLECTSSYEPTGYIYKDEEGKKALMVTAEGGKIVTTPSTPSVLNQIYSTDTIIISNTVSIKGRKNYQGNLQDEIRGWNYNFSPEEQKKNFLEEYPLSVHKLDQFHISSDKSGVESKLEYNVTLSQFGSVSGIRYFIPVNNLHPYPFSCPASASRKTDYISKEDYTETNDIFISLPSDYIIEYLPPKSNFAFQGNHYSIEITIENQFIHVHHQMTESMMRISPELYKDLCSYYTSVAKTNSQMIVLKKSKA